MKLRIWVALIGLMPIGMGVAADKPDETRQSGPKWRAHGALATPALPAATPAVSAGCVVIGHHILPDGSTARPRILKGAFTANVDGTVREAFSASALEAAKRWQFGPVDPAEASGEFHLETMGFVPASGDTPRVVVGIQEQHERLRSVCEIADLAAWGEQNAIPAEQAKAQNGDKVIVEDADSSPGYWVTVGRLTPPRYPGDAARAGAGACVVVGFTIQADGTVDGLKIMSSRVTGDVPPTPPMRTLLENHAAAAAANWRFAPGPDNLGRVPMFRQVPVEFVPPEGGRPRVCESTDVGSLLIQAASAAD